MTAIVASVPSVSEVGKGALGKGGPRTGYTLLSQLRSLPADY